MTRPAAKGRFTGIVLLGARAEAWRIYQAAREAGDVQAAAQALTILVEYDRMLTELDLGVAPLVEVGAA